MPSIGERVKVLREARGMNQADLSKQIGIKQPSLWAIENNKTKSVKGKTLAALCDVLHTTPDFLLGDVSDEESVELSMKTSEVIYTLSRLPAAGQDKLIDFARFLLAQEPASKGSPFRSKISGEGHHTPEKRKAATKVAAAKKAET
jgi:transcriptional regulator with XRE-family HTH domain